MKKIIKELIIFVDNINSEEFISVYQNKYALEELIRQGKLINFIKIFLNILVLLFNKIKLK